METVVNGTKSLPHRACVKNKTRKHNQINNVSGGDKCHGEQQVISEERMTGHVVSN